MDASIVLEHALALPAEDRRAIAEELLQSVGDGGWGLKEEGYDEAWAEEIGRRIAELDAGAPTVPVAEVIARARAMIRAAKPA